MTSNKKLNLEELKILVFEDNQATKQNKDRLFKLAKAAKDIKCIQILRDNFNFKSAKLYLEKLHTISLDEVLRTRDIEMLKLLVDKKIDLTQIKIVDLINQNYNLEFINILINAGIDINIRDKDGNTPLMIASNKGQYNIVELLVINKAELNLQNYQGFTAILKAFTAKDVYQKIIIFLIDSGANVNLTTKKFRTNALMVACLENNEQLALILLKLTKDLDAQSIDDNSALLDAVNSNMFDTVRLLLDKGANVNIQSILNGITPLMIACTQKNESMIKLLLNYSPDLKILDSSQLSVTEYAIMILDYNILKLLLENGANKIEESPAENDGQLDDETFEKRLKSIEKIALLREKIKKVILSKEEAEQFILFQVHLINSHNSDILKSFTKIHKVYLDKIQEKFDQCDSLFKRSIQLFAEIILSVESEAGVYYIEAILENIMSSYLIGIYSNDNYNEIEYDKYNNNYKYKLILENQVDGKVFIDVYDYKLIFHFLNTQNKRYSSEYKLISKNKYHDEKHGYILIIDEFIIEKSPIDNIRISKFIMKDEFDNIISHRKLNPQKLVKILTNFTADKPMKYTTHTWDFGTLKNEYTDFNGYMYKVQRQWDTIKKDFEELSPTLYKKVYGFLWETDSKKALGWSSIHGLKEWCDEGENPFEFVINDTTFGDVINSFKNEIEIRKENDKLENIFIQERKKLGRKFKVELIKLKGKTFYTNVEMLKNALGKIFSEIKKRDTFPNVKVEVVEREDTNYLDILIMQEDSEAGINVDEMYKEVESGDWKGIKENLTNLCDWSIESSFEENNYRVNYLKSDNKQEKEKLNYKPTGFTHILRFYNK